MDSLSSLKIGLLGFGTVSSGFYERLEAVEENIYRQTGFRPIITKIFVREGALSRLPEKIQLLAVTDPEAILNDPDIQVVVEAINGEEPAATYLQTALLRGKHVITANKAALANHWERLSQAAETGGARLFCEASVCAGIPLIQTIKTLAGSDKIHRIEGILNGTSNYILSAMANTQSDYSQALKEAQTLGYAEANPAADVDGWDAANKLSILCGLAFDQPIDPNDILKTSLRHLESAEKGLKVISEAQWVNGRLETAVALKQLAPEHPLYLVDGVDNGIVIHTEGIGQIRLYGPGAGANPTGTAMISDLFQLTAILNQR